MTLLWLSFALTLWLSIAHESTLSTLLNNAPINTNELLSVLFVLLSSAFLWAVWRRRSLLSSLDNQAQAHRKAILQLKKQHQAETHQIRTLIGNEQFAYWEWDIKKRSAYFSPQWKKMVGLATDAPINNLHDLQKRIHPKDQKSVQQDFFKILSGEDTYLESTHRILHEDGHYIWVHDKGQVFYTDEGDIDKLCAIRLDISEQKWIESELEVDATVIEHASEGIAIIDADLKITRTNTALKETFRRLNNTSEATDLTSLLSTLHSKPDDEIVKSLTETGHWRGELSLVDQNNELILASRVSIQKLFHDTTQNLLYIFIHSDISDLKHTEATLNNLANIDRVTGLANRNRLYQALEKTLASEQPINLIFLDLDNFKIVNDTLGHDIGDLLLKQVGQAVTQLLPENALLARIGGDEFIVYYPQTAAAQHAHDQPESPQVLAQKITDRLAQTFVIEQNKIHIGSSIGIAQYPQQASDRHSLLKAADIAMYQAKNRGKGQFCTYTPELLDS